MEERVRELVLPGGQVILARVRMLAPDEGEGAGRSEFEDVGGLDRLRDGAARINDVISGVASAVVDAARASRPSEITATFGIELAAKPGRAVAAVLADGEVKASISVTLTWQPGEARTAAAQTGEALPPAAPGS